MSSSLGQIQDRALVRPMYEAVPPTLIAPTTKEIPYDYVATFTLKGENGNRVQDVINISVDGAFVAMSIGYSFIPPRIVEKEIPKVFTSIRTRLRNTAADPNPTPNTWDVIELGKSLLVRFCGIDFKYNIVDSSTGRELQNKAIHNIAGLGEASGERPFRPMAKPMLFMPRSTIRIEIEEVSEGLPIYPGAQLFIVLHGYKILGYGTGQP